MYMHPSGRASPSVINRLIKAGSLLSPTSSSRDIRAIPSVSQAATPMKPRANLGNRTRQPKGCASRIAKPARLGRTSQNHLMMIVLNKTGATTVAQLKTTGIQQCNNAKTAPFQRFLDTVTAIQNLLPAAFGVSTRDPAALLFVAGGHSPTGRGVCCMVQRWCVCAIVFWRVVWYRAGTFLCMRSWPCMSWPRRALDVVPVVAVASLGVAVAVTSLGMPAVPWPWLWCPPSFRRRRVVATRRRTLVFAMVLTESHYPDLRNQLVAYKMGANKQTTTKRKERYSSGYADRDCNPEVPKNRRHG